MLWYLLSISERELKSTSYVQTKGKDLSKFFSKIAENEELLLSNTLTINYFFIDEKNTQFLVIKSAEGFVVVSFYNNNNNNNNSCFINS